MAQPAMHFAVGMTGGILACVPLGLFSRTRKMLVFAPLLASACGVWALVPDLPQILRMYPSVPGYRGISSHHAKGVLHRAHLDWVFFFHHTLDHATEGGELHGMAIILAYYNLMALGTIGYVIYLRRRKPDPPPLPHLKRARPQRA